MTQQTGQQMQYFLPLSKIDEEKRLVYAIAAMEMPDRSGEILDYATAKPAFTEWSDRFSSATGGMSKGNVRVMHNPKSVAGKVTEMSFDDDNKAVNVCMKIVDDAEWKKTLEGCYTGVSVGGSYLKKWKDGALTRYTPNIAEISMVDSPCIPGARIIELQKADGSVTEIVATGRAPLTYGQMMPPPTYGQLAKGLGGAARLYMHGAGLAGSALGGGIGRIRGRMAGQAVAHALHATHGEAEHIASSAAADGAIRGAARGYGVGRKAGVAVPAAGAYESLKDRKRNPDGKFSKIEGAYALSKGLGGFARIAGRMPRAVRWGATGAAVGAGLDAASSSNSKKRSKSWDPIKAAQGAEADYNKIEGAYALSKRLRRV